MELKILSFEGESFVNQNVVSVTLLTGVGEITVLENHVPLMTYVEPSTLYIDYMDENNVLIRDDFAVGRGVVEIDGKKIKILTDMLTDIADLDVEEVRRAKMNAEALMLKYKGKTDKMDMAKFLEAEEQLLRSIAQLKLYDIKK
ncbi:ATP synthase F1 subunit epsilon [Candidatus Gracilibacteria bacterium]|nr:ATP synthase F1 subunit epsilon [Candidatus Gracilibacteria bacterium]